MGSARTDPLCQSSAMGIGRFKSYSLIGWPPGDGRFFVLLGRLRAAEVFPFFGPRVRAPELVARGVYLLLSARFGRRSRIAHHTSSGQHPFIEGEILPETSTPASVAFAGGNGAPPCSTVRTGFAGAGGPWRLPPPVSAAWTEEPNRPPPPAPANIPSSEERYYRKPLLRRAYLSPEDTAPHPVLRLGLASPELVTRGCNLLRSVRFGRRSRLVHHPSSGQHSFIGGGLLPEISTPASEPFTGGYSIRKRFLKFS